MAKCELTSDKKVNRPWQSVNKPNVKYVNTSLIKLCHLTTPGENISSENVTGDMCDIIYFSHVPDTTSLIEYRCTLSILDEIPDPA